MTTWPITEMGKARLENLGWIFLFVLLLIILGWIVLYLYDEKI